MFRRMVPVRPPPDVDIAPDARTARRSAAFRLLFSRLGALLLLTGNILGLAGLYSYLKQSQPTVTTLAADESSALVAAPVRAQASELVPAEIDHACPDGCAAPLADCRVKGDVVMSTGERLYYLPDDRVDDEIEIDGDVGERWFCDEADALQSGWVRGSDNGTRTPTCHAAMLAPAATIKPTSKPKLVPKRSPTPRRSSTPTALASATDTPARLSQNSNTRAAHHDA